MFAGYWVNCHWWYSVIDNIGKLKIATFPCLRCGTCCSKYQPRLSRDEVYLISEKSGISFERFLAEYTDPRWPGTQSYLLRHVNNACIFLRYQAEVQQYLCSIHAFKPLCCQEWKAGLNQIECRECLKKRWGLTADTTGQVCGPLPAIESFKNYLHSLEPWYPDSKRSRDPIWIFSQRNFQTVKCRNSHRK